MPFIICEDQKQNINLSHASWATIYDDMQNFHPDDNPNLSGFLNTVFNHFYMKANASMQERLESYKEDIKQVLTSHACEHSKEIINAFMVRYKSQLKTSNLYYSKGIAKKFRLNNENYDYLTKESQDDQYYHGSAGAYLKACFEEYAQKPYAKREQIYFNPLFETVVSAVGRRKQLRLWLQNGKKFKLSPYAIMTDKVGSFHYLVAIDEHKKHVSFRLSRIKDIKILESQPSKLTKTDQTNLEKLLHKLGPQFLSGETLTIRIRLTPKGIERYHQQIHMRPPMSDTSTKDVYEVYCSEIQALFYFFKFGREAEILTPKSLRHTFRRYYQTALENYGENGLDGYPS